MQNMRRASITAILTCHNRRAATMRCLDQLQAAATVADVDLTAVLIDDGSTDGTAETVSRHFPWVHIECTDGSLFWNRSMHRGQAITMQQASDYLLWINDDTEILTNAISNLLETAHILQGRHQRPSIVVGSTADRASGRLSYGGLVARRRFRPFSYERIWTEAEPVECHVMNGNVVLIPMEIAREVGNLDPVFEHAMGDTDYALRARSKGFRIFVAPGFVGYCSNNFLAGTYRDSSLPFMLRWKKMMDRKGLPPRSWWHFTHKHGGAFWPVYFFWPYCRLIIGSFIFSIAK